MREFFKKELETLQVKTGIRQHEYLMQKEDWKKEVSDLLDLLIEECNKPPYNLVKPEVKERVIARAILEDQDFIGLNPKFIRKALNAWWGIYGQKILEARDQMEKNSIPKVELSPEQNEAVDVLLKSYVSRLLSGDGPKMVPKIENYKQEGAEWKSEIERKGVAKGYKPLSEAEVIDKQLHIQYIRENYDPYTGKPKPNWVNESQWRESLQQVPVPSSVSLDKEHKKE